jgi:hypothetical protein
MFYPTMTLRPAVKAHGTMGETIAVFEKHHGAHQEKVGMEQASAEVRLFSTHGVDVLFWRGGFL